MKTETLTFKGSSGDALAAKLDLPTGDPQAYAIYAHCFTCTKEFVAAKGISRALASRGIATLRFDFAGLGKSGGVFADKNFSTNVEDLVFGADFLGQNYQAPKILVGHSLGGTAVLAAAPLIKSAKAVATIGAPFDPSHVSHLFEHYMTEIETAGEADVDLFGRTFKIKKQFLADINSRTLEDKIANLDKALLIMHSPQDDIVDLENARMIYKAARHPKSFVSLDGAHHLLTDKRDSDYVAEILAAWATRYIDGAAGAGELAAKTPGGQSRLIN